MFQVIRVGAMEFKENDSTQRRKTINHASKKSTESIRRPFGVAIYDVTEILNGKVEREIDNECLIYFFPCLERDTLDATLKRACSIKKGEILKDKKGQTISISLKLLYGDLEQVKKDYPHLIADFTTLQIARKMGIPDVIMPGDFRNDLYLTLIFGDFSFSSSAKSIEVSVKVCNDEGKTLTENITMGPGAEYLSEYKSVVYYHEERPKWMETIKISLSIKDFKNSHLKFTYKHRSLSESKDKKNERPFAFSFLKLMNEDGTTLADQVYELLVYKVDWKVFEKTEADMVYLHLPSSRSELESKSNRSWSNFSSKIHLGDSVPGLTLIPKNVCFASTVLCSTKLTQNIDLLGLLKFQSNKLASVNELKECIIKLMDVDGKDIVKFLVDTLDSLFKILSNENSQDLRFLILGAIVYIISLVSDRKFMHFRPVLDHYIEKTFSATLVYSKLIETLRKFFESLSSANSPFAMPSNGIRSSTRSNSSYQSTPGFNALNVMKGLEFLFKFIVRSRCLFIESRRSNSLFMNSVPALKNDDKDFSSSIDSLFNAMAKFMSISNSEILPLQVKCLKYFPSAIPHILLVFDRDQLCIKITQLITVVNYSMLKKERMIYMLDMINCEQLFEDLKCRLILIPVLTENTKFLLNNKEELPLCVQVLSDILRSLHLRSIDEIKSDIEDLTVSIIRPVIETVIRRGCDEPLTGNLVAILIGILRLMTPYHYEHYIKSLHPRKELLDFLMEIIMVFKDLVSSCVYPSDWSEMILLQNSVILSSLKQLSAIIREHFSERDFEHQLWNNFFYCSISFMTQKSLQLENFSLRKREKIIRRYKDMRIDMASVIRKMWSHLGSHTIDFVPVMVGLFLEMALIPDTTLRNEIVPIFFEMFLQEFHFKGNFYGCEQELISELDKFIEGGKGDEEFRQMFKLIMKPRFESSRAMREPGLKLVASVDRLMKHLLEYRSVVSNINEDNEDKRMLCMVNLMEFYYRSGRKEMYLRYLTKLVDIHTKCENFTEAAFALCLYIDSLNWSKELLPSSLRNEKYQDCRTQREMKEKLYEKIIEYFEKGEQWEEGIRVCEDLVHKYKRDLIDYQRTADTLLKQSVFYQNIVTKDRYFCGYYRVSYIGEGFPEFIRNKVFVHRGKPYEAREDFIKRLKAHFPDAIELKSLSPPSNELKSSEKQYLQINKVDPLPKVKEEFNIKAVHPNVKKFYESNQVQEFTESRIFQRNDIETNKENEFASTWKVKTTLKTSYPFPGISTWFHVISTTVQTLSPIQNAIEDLEMAKQSVIKQINELYFKPNAKYDMLLSKVQGIIQPAVNGGIPNYEQAFIVSNYCEDDSDGISIADKRRYLDKLKDTIASIPPIVEIALTMLRIRVSSEYMELYRHLETVFEDVRRNIREKYGEMKPPSELEEIHEIEKEKPSVSDMTMNKKSGRM